MESGGFVWGEPGKLKPHKHRAHPHTLAVTPPAKPPPRPDRSRPSAPPQLHLSIAENPRSPLTRPPPARPFAGCCCPNCNKAAKKRASGLAVVEFISIGGPALDSSPEELLEITEGRETLRRQRISDANRGKTAWNKGLRHSEETKAKIRERTMLAMKAPEMRKRLSEAAAAQRHTCAPAAPLSAAHSHSQPRAHRAALRSAAAASF